MSPCYFSTNFLFIKPSFIHTSISVQGSLPTNQDSTTLFFEKLRLFGLYLIILSTLKQEIRGELFILVAKHIRLKHHLTIKP